MAATEVLYWRFGSCSESCLMVSCSFCSTWDPGVRLPVGPGHGNHGVEEAMEEAEGTLDSFVPVVPALGEGTEEHEVDAERIGPELLDDGVRNDDVPLALGHLGPFTNDEAVLPEPGEGLLEIQVPHVLQGHGDEPGVEEVQGRRAPHRRCSSPPEATAG